MEIESRLTDALARLAQKERYGVGIASKGEVLRAFEDMQLIQRSELVESSQTVLIGCCPSSQLRISLN